MTALKKLNLIRENSGKKITTGLTDQELEPFLVPGSTLEKAIDEAALEFENIKKIYPELLSMEESSLVSYLQDGITNFYPKNQINPYVPIAACGPWIVTLNGAVVHDSGGYGMLGFGHGPSEIISVLAKNYVMANVMTASFHQKKLVDKLNKEIGHERTSKTNLYNKYVFLNSGSEAVTLALRISDLNAQNQIVDKKISESNVKFLVINGSFHGRTDRPAQASDSTIKNYKMLASFANKDNMIKIDSNNIDQLNSAFDDAAKQNIFIESFLLEPVMGEGNPGQCVTPEFYQRARELTKKHNTLLIVDSIQAGFRGTGSLSLMDYPGFENQDPPDMESFSKALNAGQFPLSIVALNKTAADLYKPGIYGNTMTANPRALEVACKVLDLVDNKVRNNIKEMGLYFLAGLNSLKSKYPKVAIKTNGTGLLCAIELNSSYKVVGERGVERVLRERGIGVVHGGVNALRFTPHFKISKKEIDLILYHVEQILSKEPNFT